MYTTEATVILPIILLILFSLLIIGWFLIEQVQTILFLERSFLVELIEKNSSKGSGNPMKIHLEIKEYGVFQKYRAKAIYEKQNPFSSFAGHTSLHMVEELEAVIYRRMALRFLIKGGGLILETN